MTNQPRIPDAETRARSVAKMQEVVKRWDVLIADLDELNLRLQTEQERNLEAARQRGNAKRQAGQI
ncbi:hypothetical protein NG798_25000 [Ancylothrix sp. C2]|uniref:hypothetical protein n=1 Tax=Ancylothrix sp. D3o TaxID=2953691 RepID=UPI0021BAD298|nr:hypothetical protein [Ancylothrix sp. D3o]MCT7953060.1 hypothetical protein [Ancylothrix sp. D3o]